MKTRKRILIVDDEVKIVEVLSAYLEKSGYEVLKAYDGKQALDLFKASHLDLIVLDLMLPKITGENVCKAIRRVSRVPIIMLTAKITEEQKIEGLDIGADDYMTKPFSPRELVARINSLLRRLDTSVMPLFREMSWNKNDLEVEFYSCVVKKASHIVNLTPNEFKILCTLVKYPKKIFTREELIEVVLGIEYTGYERTIDTHIKNLRSKIEDDTTKPRYIETVRGVGYRFGADE